MKPPFGIDRFVPEHGTFALAVNFNKSGGKTPTPVTQTSMNKHLFFSTILAACFSLASCKKSDPERQVTTVEPIKTAKGVAAGPAVSKQIGSGGGELISSDGNLKLTVPAGAVSAATEFSIQPITNTLFEEDGRMAYRLLPEGTTFSKAIQLEFTYTPGDTVNTTEDLLTVAFQRADGAWKVMPTVLDKAAKKLKVETTHFSDWTITGGLYINAENIFLGMGQKTKLWVYSVYRPSVPGSSSDDDDVLAPLPPRIEPADREKIESINNWRIAPGGIGGITVESGQLGKMQTEAEYSAPATMTPNRKTVTITVDVNGYNLIKDPAAPGGVRRMNRIILFEHLTLVKEYMKGSFDGKDFEFVSPHVMAELTPMFNSMVFVGSGNAFDLTLSTAGAGVGEYRIGNTGTNVQVTFSNGSAGYVGSWAECSQLGLFHYSPYPIKVTKWSDVGEYVEGSYAGEVYLADGVCGKRAKMLFVEFSIVRDR